MIEPPMVSPVTAETMPAANRISDKGSSSRRAIAPSKLVRFATASALGPYRPRRASASWVLSPSRLQSKLRAQRVRRSRPEVLHADGIGFGHG